MRCPVAPLPAVSWRAARLAPCTDTRQGSGAHVFLRLEAMRTRCTVLSSLAGERMSLRRRCKRRKTIATPISLVRSRSEASKARQVIIVIVIEAVASAAAAAAKRARKRPTTERARERAPTERARERVRVSARKAAAATKLVYRVVLVDAGVKLAPSLGVHEHCVRLTDLLKRGVGPARLIWMRLERGNLVGLLDLVLGRGRLDAEHLVVVLCRQGSAHACSAEEALCSPSSCSS